ncbi:MAG: EAL domain-containing protein [Alphaproteobacteria bacterium]|nr:EAL domain-containing protein [Alphaproteobacteria bacterium]
MISAASVRTRFDAFLGVARRIGARRARLAAVLVALAVALSLGAFQPLDNALNAFRARILQRAPTHTITIVAIDPESLRADNEWPWPRERYARVIDNLRTAGATLIGFDIDFSARSDDQSDDALRQAIDADPGAIVLPTFVQRDGVNRNLPLAALSENAIFAGVNVPIDPDGAARRYFRGYVHDGAYTASMASVLAGAPYGDVSAFTLDFGIRLDQIDVLSFQDVYTGRFDPERVRGRVILIGATALEFGDVFPTVAGPATPGVAIHALAYENLLQGRALMPLTPLASLGAAFLVLALLWPRAGALDVRRLLWRHGAVASAAILGPLVLQAMTPVMIDAGVVLAAQAISLIAAIQYELARRKSEVARQREAHLRHAATHHSETGLTNRRAALAALEQAMAAKQDGVIAVVVVGVSRFRTLRAAIGHARANDVMTRLSKRIAEVCGEGAVFYLSTATFCAWLDAADCKEALRRIQDCLQHLDTRVELDGQEFDLALRAGAAISPTAQGAPEALLENAARALDEAQAQKRAFLAFDAANFPDPQLRLTMLSAMQAGLSRNEFRLVYQPKASARDGAIVGAEALMRWTHHEHGPIPPGRFILAAEETGAIDPLTRWAIIRAIEDQAAMRAAGVFVPISVNVSARSLSDAKFCDFAVDAVKRSGATLCFEITETAIIDDPVEALTAIDEFRAAGIKIAIDDYGAGLSSLAYLKQIAADELKLDKSLVDDMEATPRDRLIVKSTIDLAHGLGLTVVAEGVEDEMITAALAAMGCDLIQGYHVSKPLPLDDFITLCGVRAAAA